MACASRRGHAPSPCPQLDRQLYEEVAKAVPVLKRLGLGGWTGKQAEKSRLKSVDISIGSDSCKQ